MGVGRGNVHKRYTFIELRKQNGNVCVGCMCVECECVYVCVWLCQIVNHHLLGKVHDTAKTLHVHFHRKAVKK